MGIIKEDLETALVNEMSRQIADEIDSEFMKSMLVASGWTCCGFGVLWSTDKVAKVNEWLKRSCQGRYRQLGWYLLFENSNDATMYTLKWGSYEQSL